MSGSIDDLIKDWCKNAEPLVGLKSAAPKEAVRQSWTEFQDFVGKNLGPIGMSDTAWQTEKLKIQTAVDNHDIGAKDLNVTGDPMTLMEKLGSRIVDARELGRRVSALKIGTAGKNLLRLSGDRKDLLTKLETAQLAWKTADDEATSYGESDVNAKAYPEAWEEAGKTRPAAQDLSDAIRAASADEAQGCVDEYRQWFKQAKAAVEKIGKLKRDYGGGAANIEGWQWIDLAKVANRLDALVAEYTDALGEAKANLDQKQRDNEGKGRFGSLIAALERDFRDTMVEWNKTTTGPLDRGYEGEKAAGLLPALTVRATALGDSEEYVIDGTATTDPNWTALVMSVTNHYNAFKTAGSAAVRLTLRGPTAPPTLREYLSANFNMDQRVQIGGKWYTVSPSDTAGVAFHTPIPKALLISWRPNVKSFIYHFR